MTEAPAEKNPSGISSEAQGSVVPLGWTPTKAHPVPVVRCIQIKKDGMRCKKWSLRGYTKCFRHAGPGAAMPDGNVNKYREAVIEAARIRLIDEVDPAIDGLVSLTEPGTSEGIRLKAYTEILDRAGVRGGFEVDVTVEETGSPVEELRRRMEDLRASVDVARKIREGDDDVVDAEIVDDEQPALFELESEDGK